MAPKMHDRGFASEFAAPQNPHPASIDASRLEMPLKGDKVVAGNVWKILCLERHPKNPRIFPFVAFVCVFHAIPRLVHHTSSSTEQHFHSNVRNLGWTSARFFPRGRKAWPRTSQLTRCPAELPETVEMHGNHWDQIW
jgi:hypothetical protein